MRGSRPNIILVMTDDQGYGDLGCHGNPTLKTPNLDRLHAQSVRFTRFQVSPTCSPTRSALMSGRHPMKNGVTHTLAERERMALTTVTVPEVLKTAGYTTGVFGKWHLGDEEPYQPHNRGFDEAFIHGGGGIGQRFKGTSCADAPPNQQKRYFDPVIRHNGTFVKTTGFCTDVFFRQALGWVNRQRQQNQPFFAYIATNAPHGPMVAPETYRKRFVEQGMKDKQAGFFGMIENIDDNMGLLMQKLRDWQLERNTLLIFMTDNGTSAGKAVFNAGMKGAKGSTDEGGTRVPAFFRCKGVLGEGVDVSALAAHIDMFPTLAELAGARLPPNDQVEGRSLVPLLRDPGAEWADRCLYFHRGRWQKGADPEPSKYKGCAVRTQRFRLVNNSQLYDMTTDPGQKTNVFERHPDVVERLRAAYDAWWTETRPLMVNESAPVYAGDQPFVQRYAEQLEGKGIPDWVPPEI